MKKIAVVSLVLAAACVLGAAFAHEPALRRGSGDPAAARMVGRLVDDPAIQQQLELSSDQLARLRTIRDQTRDTIRELRERTSRARADLKEAVRRAKSSRQEIEKAAAAARSAVNDLSQEVTRALLDAREVLSAEQREKLGAILDEKVRVGRRRVRGWRHRGTVDGQSEKTPSADSPDDGTLQE